MRLVLSKSLRAKPNGDVTHDIGAAVARAVPGGGVVLELGPADGPPHLRLHLSGDEAARLSATVRGVADGGGEAILLVDE
ncbi:MAG: hypothetical protein AVDCRST_MAG49-1653 [uncultured Thermomicrobiales bacterium]|uniref:Uncharacterized protein n=1 Tax=uncultured Thermomicrobiales bacterium TaxID=1645740 RepID=A0A6J4UK01_9BACT|nr:MAG: hypothetical protein AVDCRST_MAG49-1653 [uncultured Thermomicrobiales bacterium]